MLALTVDIEVHGQPHCSVLRRTVRRLVKRFEETILHAAQLRRLEFVCS